MARKSAANPMASCIAEGESGYVMTLPASMQGETATQIADAILSARTNALIVDATAVERIDTPCIQVLMSAARLWREDGMPLTWSGRSTIFEENLDTLGLSAADLEVGDANHA